MSFQASKLPSFLAFVLVGCAHTAEPARPLPPGPTASMAWVAPPPPVPSVAPAPPRPVSVGDVESGRASWYGKALAGHKTASGERFNPSAMTAAHKTLPLGTWVVVKRTGTNKVVRVRINDRGPFGAPDWIIDLSRAAFEQLGSIREGVIPVDVHVVALPVRSGR